MILSFSGTGNSRYCAQFLADSLGDQHLDIAPFLRDGVAAQLHSDQPWVLVAPTYSWQLPKVVADFFRAAHLSGSRAVYFVMTCGGEIGAAPEKNRALCLEKGLLYCGTLPVVMPDNYLVLFRPPLPEQALPIIQAAKPVLEKGAGRILRREDFPWPKIGRIDRFKSGVVNTLFNRYQIKTKPFTVQDACICCGQCERACPLGNVQLIDGKPVWGNRCTHCMGCISICPVQAIDYGKSTRGKPRYRFPADWAE